MIMIMVLDIVVMNYRRQHWET